jgi:hypothetical protein
LGAANRRFLKLEWVVAAPGNSSGSTTLTNASKEFRSVSVAYLQQSYRKIGIYQISIVTEAEIKSAISQEKRMPKMQHRDEKPTKSVCDD